VFELKVEKQRSEKKFGYQEGGMTNCTPVPKIFWCEGCVKSLDQVVPTVADKGMLLGQHKGYRQSLISIL
jgi:hypothetical protein